jgi:transcriptional regulator with XRE-family HTH domain
MRSITSMVLREVLPDYGCRTLTDLARGLGLPKQYAWMLWHGKVALSLELLRRIHDVFGVPVEVLAHVERATPAKRRGRKPRESRESPPPAEDQA